MSDSGIYRIQLVCSGVPSDDGERAAKDITQEFAEQRPHHQNVVCVFEDGQLFLTAENDFDADGKALIDEFSDEITNCIATPFDGRISLVRSEKI